MASVLFPTSRVSVCPCKLGPSARRLAPARRLRRRQRPRPDSAPRGRDPRCSAPGGAASVSRPRAARPVPAVAGEMALRSQGRCSLPPSQPHPVPLTLRARGTGRQRRGGAGGWEGRAPRTRCREGDGWVRSGWEGSPPLGRTATFLRSARAPGGRAGGWRRWTRASVVCERGEQRGSARGAVPARSRAEESRLARAGWRAPDESRHARGAKKVPRSGSFRPGRRRARSAGSPRGRRRRRARARAP